MFLYIYYQRISTEFGETIYIIYFPLTAIHFQCQKLLKNRKCVISGFWAYSECSINILNCGKIKQELCIFSKFYFKLQHTVAASSNIYSLGFYHNTQQLSANFNTIFSPLQMKLTPFYVAEAAGGSFSILNNFNNKINNKAGIQLDHVYVYFPNITNVRILWCFFRVVRFLELSFSENIPLRVLSITETHRRALK